MKIFDNVEKLKEHIDKKLNFMSNVLGDKV